MTKSSKTKTNSLQNNNAMTQDLLKNQIHKICRYDEMCRCLIENLIQGRQHKFKKLINAYHPQDEIDLILAEMEYTGELISQTAHDVTALHWKMEKELESMEQEIWQGDVSRSTLARYSGLITTAEIGIFMEIERMEQNDLISTMAVYVELMAEQEPKPEIEQQLKLVVEYRHMVKNINTEHMKQQIKEELQIKILKQHEARYQRSKTSPTKKELEETDARLRMREVQHDTKHSSWQVGQKSQEDQMVSGEKEKSQEYQMVSSESFKQSKKDALKLVTQK